MHEHLQRDIEQPVILGTGAALVVDDACWAYFPTPVRGVLGTVLVWAQSRGVTQTNLIVDTADAALAFTATGFASPAPAIWQAVERTLERVDAQSPAIAPPPDCPESTAMLSLLGLEVVADHGVWLGELNGLELARVGLREGACEVDIGVGAYDQFASAALNLDRDDEAALEVVLSMVQPHRVPGADPHPMGRLVRSRWLRAQLVTEPGLIGLASLNPIPLLVARPGLVEPQPCAGIGVTADGQDVLVVCSTGIDLGVVETAAGLAALTEAQRVIVAMPPRDHHRRIAESLTLLRVPAKLVAIDGAWSD